MHTQTSDAGFTIEVDGQAVPAKAGQTVAAVMIGAGMMVFHHAPSGEPRGLFCGMGVCFDCLVTVNDLADQRACVTLAQPGMRVSTRDARNA